MRRLISATALMLMASTALAGDFTSPGSRAQSNAEACQKRAGIIQCMIDKVVQFTISSTGVSLTASGVLSTGTVELGGTTDTTLSRSGAGEMQIEGVDVVEVNDSPTLGTLTTTGTIELGNASDTTLSRSAAGELQVEGVDVVEVNDSPTLGTLTTTGTIELGNASDTTIARVSAGVISVEGVNVVLSSRTLTGGTGIAAIGDLSTDRTISFAATELNDLTWGDNSDATIAWTFDHSGGTNTVLQFSDGALLGEGIASFRRADAANAGGEIRILEDPGTGSDYIAFQAPASITATFTCVLENDANPIPDSCVGDGTDSGGSGDAIRVEDGDNAGTFTAMSDADFDDSGDINFARAAGPPDVLTATVRADSVALTTDTTGNYVADLTAGHGITKTGAAGEAWSPTVNTAPWVVYPVYAALGGL